MKLRLRYLSALCINVLLPVLAYRLAYPHWGLAGGLVTSALPPLAWMICDFVRFRHFDALSMLIVASIALSLVAVPLGGPQNRALEEPIVSGVMGIVFLISLAFHRPIVFYLARSTTARENTAGISIFEQNWSESPRIAAEIRRMTLVWGVGLITENTIRSLIVWRGADTPHAVLASTLVFYGVYGSLMLWTFWRRRGIRQDAQRMADARANAQLHSSTPDA
ncbi:VC0807 family protein [Paraburkholderia sp. DHOC27]|uniref:VC0807 family protein n=1 Tax=Paraburkholderia sp. DHOC27 TaxID=2303330 RepID=UPI000E3D41F9|nr:VC0807 family protein [Paraburkholderia sp. DHOC27]RFU49798.1 hypothetical protein D0B32_01160 [Paraburkholderia sp. DHOC27]